MMKVAQINCTSKRGSTGRIVQSIKDKLDFLNVENFVFYSLTDYNDASIISFSNKIIRILNSVISHVFGIFGFEDFFATRRLLKLLKKKKPNIIHLHNVHSHDVNLNLLFKFLKKRPDIKVIWTVHYCWAFTGYCVHYDYIKCNNWKTNCQHCPLKRDYSFFFDCSKSLYNKKRKLLEDSSVIFVTPSLWLRNQGKQSFLKNCRFEVINNGIDLSIFKPTISDFRTKYDVSRKKIILAVAYKFNKTKGIDDLWELSKMLSDDYALVIVGSVSEKLDFSKRVILIEKTENQVELAKIYTTADIFINPTYEDTFPTTNIEALACGTPVITYETGGSTEILDEGCGVVVEKGNIHSLYKAILSFDYGKFSKSNCVERSKQFTNKLFAEKYIDLYYDIFYGK